MNEQTNIELKALCGEHVLTGVDRNKEPFKNWAGEDFRDVINFTLDGVTYSACENPDDGYRSHMDHLRVSSNPTTNTFPPCRVVARMQQSKNKYEEGRDVLELVDAVTGKAVLEVGTANTDDYYPYFVSHFAPENMAINVGK